MDDLSIIAVLSSVVKTYAEECGIDIAWENTGYKPTQGEKYLEVFYLPGEPVTGINGQVQNVGIYQININEAATQGRGAALTTVTELRAAYGRTAVLSGTGRVAIKSMELGQPQDNGQWWTEILNISWLV